ncbi:hypothetical protein F5Y17DRAFT_61822 [Xylariaceae sp. FL0594]|nr:hypothetical protein F5Y17DRAFT_61822 [Xylariaceae sp. FL0594]
MGGNRPGGPWASLVATVLFDPPLLRTLPKQETSPPDISKSMEGGAADNDRWQRGNQPKTGLDRGPEPSSAAPNSTPTVTACVWGVRSYMRGDGGPLTPSLWLTLGYLASYNLSETIGLILR